MKTITIATYITIFATSITWANPSASEFGDVNLTTPVYTASETQQVVSNAVKDIPKNVTNIVKGLTDAPLASKRGKYDLTVYRDDIYKGTIAWRVVVSNITDNSVSIHQSTTRYISESSDDIVWEGDGVNVSAIKDDETGTYPNLYVALSDLGDTYGEVVPWIDGQTFQINLSSVGYPSSNIYTFSPVYEQLATTATVQPLVTNIVRDVVNTVYDEKLGISWKQVMYDGNIYYIPVTNANITVVGD